MHRFLHLRSVHAEDRAIQQALTTAPKVATPAAGALVIGALLDGIPESAAIGISLLDGKGIGLAFVAAVFLSNIPEGMAASAGLRASGRSVKSILALWLAVAVVAAFAAGLGVCRARSCRTRSPGWDPRVRCRSCPRDARDDDAPRGCRSRGPLGWARHRAGVRGGRPPRRALTRSPPASQVRRAGRTSVANRSTWSRPAPGHPQ
jgi:hypothetical protein